MPWTKDRCAARRARSSKPPSGGGSSITPRSGSARSEGRREVECCLRRRCAPFPRFRLGVAGSMSQSLAGIGPIFAPVVRLSYHFTSLATSLVAVGLRLSALGTQATATALAGSAQVGQDLAMADLLL